MAERNHQPKTLYVRNLDPSVSETSLTALFSEIDPVKNCTIIREPGNELYAFIEYFTHEAACTALIAMNKRIFLNKPLKINWAYNSGPHPRAEFDSNHDIFVGNLDTDVGNEKLQAAFAPFGEISSVRIVRDPVTLKSKGYAFISFVNKADARQALRLMNEQRIGSRAIHINWSARKLLLAREKKNQNSMTTRHKTLGNIYEQTSPTNTTVYCGGFPINVISDQHMRQHFMKFGPIEDVRVLKNQGYGFIKFFTKESATLAIEQTHKTFIHGHLVKCFWAKENKNDDSTKNNAETPATTTAEAMITSGDNKQVSIQQTAAPATNTVANAAAAPGGASLPNQMLIQRQMGVAPVGPAVAAQYPYQTAAYQRMDYSLYPPPSYPPASYPPASYPPAMMQTNQVRMQQKYNPYAYTGAQQARGIPANYLMMQSRLNWDIPRTDITMSSISAPTASTAAPATEASNDTRGPRVQRGPRGPQIIYTGSTQYQFQ